ncbi:MAG: anaerobic glycerol-3-phosphate dehydrogenase subunit GlpA [Desulfovibrionaceae bacterium]|nr:anaerobic glycerol-3-phosphate dehydrogenase subunit GlpA [Desulfovibrionaceae bacterium]
MLETTVVVIGGGATGTGTLRDLSMRGVPAILLEQGGLAHGTSSRFHGLLHSGGRYAVNDTTSARECIEENMIVRRIGRQCVEECEGFFALTPHDDPAFAEPWAAACRKAGIDAQELDVAEALHLEPNLAADIRRVFRVPDSCVDGFRLTLHNAMSAQRHGGQVLTHHELIGITHRGGRICGVTALDRIHGNRVEIACQYVINAAGSWSGRIAGLAGLNSLHGAVSPDKGTLIVFNHRFTSRVINRLHPGADGDIFVPHGSITILGTTSSPTDRPDDTTPSSADVLRLLELGEPLFPQVRQYRILRAFAGTRPLYTPGNAAGRQASRNFHVVDHAEEGLAGLVSIFGGKLTTYRLMAERVCDRVCAGLGVSTPCRTAQEALIAEPDPQLLRRAARHFPVQGLGLMADRLGDDLPKVLERAETVEQHMGARGYDGNPLLCECEMVSLAEIECVAEAPSSHSLSDIRLRTRLGMGTCQGTFCSVRTIGALVEHGITLNTPPADNVRRFLQERWRGLRPALWGGQAREMELGRAVYAGTLNLDGAAHEQED